MSRQRLRESNVKWHIKLTKESYALKILKLLELKSIENKAKIIEMKVNESIKTFMEETLKENLNYFKNKNKLKINLEKDNNFDISEYIIEFKSKNNKILEKIEDISLLKNSLINEKSD